MKLGMTLGYSGGTFENQVDLVRQAESLGFDSVWTAEAWGSDAVSPAAWLLASTTKINVGTAIMQMSARTPAMAAMTAMTLTALSGGRFILGIGPSGPQVIEGWHGVPYGRPLTRTREYIDIIRKILDRKQPLEHKGYHYQIPYMGEGSTGLGKPLKSILHGDPSLQIVTGAISPAGIAVAAEVADGFIPVFMNPARYDVFEGAIKEGFAKAGGKKNMDNFTISPFVNVIIGDDLEKCRIPVKNFLALYIGGMGARGKNFYNDYAVRLGYGGEAKIIQDLYLDGKKAEAAAAVPDKLCDEIALLGPADRVKDRLQAYIQAGKNRHITSLLAAGLRPDSMRLLAEEVL
ncbi:MAG TPA: LLM class F420-dependent oxidoreductase [Alphaproteobacteria bacterium]|nr:LLM class F420-dependent oxidoreductase [Alphaproteobacteria bacterium]